MFFIAYTTRNYNLKTILKNEQDETITGLRARPAPWLNKLNCRQTQNPGQVNQQINW